jgi:Fels-1 Prophage Protein-like
MRSTMPPLALCLALIGGACAPPQLSLSTGETGGWADSTWPPSVRTDRDVWVLPGATRDPFHRAPVVCDQFGRCWRHDRTDRFAYGDRERRAAEPPGWAERLPDSAQTDDRFLSPRSGLLCDRATRICYKDGNLDRSDTKHVFGKQAGKRADQLRDAHGTARVFVPERGVPCDRERRVCFDDGTPDRGLTRRYFGRRAARKLD